MPSKKKLKRKLKRLEQRIVNQFTACRNLQKDIYDVIDYPDGEVALRYKTVREMNMRLEKAIWG